MIPFDGNGVFRPAANEDGLRRMAVRSAGVTVFAQGLVFAVQLVATVVLARLLTPADFGVVAMATTFSLLLVSFGLNGFTEAILERDQVDHFLASNLFWINLAGGLLLTAVFAASAPLLARFYGDRQVSKVVVVMSVSITISSLSVLHLALLKRGMRFSAVSANDILGRSLSVIVSIILAWAGWGYWALVAGPISQTIVVAVGAWIQCRWVPSLPRRVSGTGAMVKFAMNTYGRFSVNYFARNLDNVLVGWRFGPGPLGFYKKAYDLFVLPANQLTAPLTTVAVAALSRYKHDAVHYRKYLLGAISVLAFVGMGVGMNLSLAGKDVIVFLLGAKWEPAGRIFRYFGPGIGMMLIYATHGWIHLSIGKADRWFRWVAVELSVTALLFLLGLPWGPIGIAVAWGASFWILTIPAFWYAGRPIQFGVGPVIGAVWKFFLASVLAGGASLIILNKLPSFVATRSIALFGRILYVSLLSWTLYIAAVVTLHRGFHPLRQIVKLLREMMPNRFSRRAAALDSAVSNAGANSPVVAPSAPVETT